MGSEACCGWYFLNRELIRRYGEESQEVKERVKEALMAEKDVLQYDDEVSRLRDIKK